LLPIGVQKNIEALLNAAASKPSLKKAREQLTQRYREAGVKMAGFVSPEEAIAYVAARMPATFAAVQAALGRVPLDIFSVLDLGAGPGTAALAAALHWPACSRFHLVEGDSFMKGVSQRILQDVVQIASQTFSFQQANLTNLSIDDSYDLVILSYVLNELSIKDQTYVLKRAWEKSSKGLVIVVPGTPASYQQLMGMRNLLIEGGAFIAAPCPHHNACPLVGGDWCHFSTRLARSSSHREIKGVSLSFEDEKFSYLVALKEPAERSLARIIKRPLKGSGHVLLDLCTKDGLKRQTLSKREKAKYKAATNGVWGDGLDVV
jgi:ribosomal protein RSM22 (predicted rRNA methylase)